MSSPDYMDYAESEWAGMKSAAMPVVEDNKNEALIANLMRPRLTPEDIAERESIQAEFERLGLYMCVYGQDKAELINNQIRNDSQGLRFSALTTASGNTDSLSIIKQPKTETEVLAAIFALIAKKQLLDMLGSRAKIIRNPPGFVKKTHPTKREQIIEDPDAKNAQIIDKGEHSQYSGVNTVSILLPRKFVTPKSIANPRVVLNSDVRDVIIMIVKEGKNGAPDDVICVANVCFKLTINLEDFSSDKIIFINFFGMKNRELNPELLHNITGTQMLKLIERCLMSIKVEKHMIPIKITAFNIDELLKKPNYSEIRGMAIRTALTFWTNNMYNQMSKTEALDQGESDTQMLNSSDVTVISKPINPAALARLAVSEEQGKTTAAAEVAEGVFASSQTIKHDADGSVEYDADDEPVVEYAPQSQGDFISARTGDHIPVDSALSMLSHAPARRSSFAGSAAQTPMDNSMSFVRASRVGRNRKKGILEQGAANATHYNPFGAGGGMPIGINRQQQMGSEIVNRQIQDEVDNINRFGASKEDEDAKTDAMLEEEESDVTTDKWDLTLSNLQQDMEKPSSNLRPGFTGIRIPSAGMKEPSNILGTSIPSAGMVKASNSKSNSKFNSNSNSNSNSISAGIERQNPNTFSLSNLNSINFGKDKKWEERQKTYQDMIREQKEAAAESNKRAYDDFVRKSEEVAARPASIQSASIQSDSKVGEKRGPNWLSDAEWSTDDETPKPKPLTKIKRSSQGGRKTKRRQTNKKSVTKKTNKKSVTKKTKKRNTRQRRTLRVTKKRSTRQTKRRHK